MMLSTSSERHAGEPSVSSSITSSSTPTVHAPNWGFVGHFAHAGRTVCVAMEPG